MSDSLFSPVAWAVEPRPGGRTPGAHLARWRQKAREARDEAASLENDEARRVMLDVAATYDRLASFIEAHLRH